jgi:hypothetical protein
MFVALTTVVRKVLKSNQESFMRKILGVAIFLMLIQSTGFAQSSNERRGWGYAFGGAGSSAGDFSKGYFQFGAGGEAVVNKGWA